MKRKKLLKLLSLIESYEKMMNVRGGMKGYGVGHPQPEPIEKPRLGEPDPLEEDETKKEQEKVKISKAFKKG